MRVRVTTLLNKSIGKYRQGVTIKCHCHKSLIDNAQRLLTCFDAGHFFERLFRSFSDLITPMIDVTICKLIVCVYILVKRDVGEVRGFFEDVKKKEPPPVPFSALLRTRC